MRSEIKKHLESRMLGNLHVRFGIGGRVQFPALHHKKFRQILKSSGVKPIRTLPMAPHLNCVIERFIRTIKSECLNKMLIFGERHLEYLTSEFVQHYHKERAHQGLDNEIIEPPPKGTGEIICQERLGGLLNFYGRAA